ncbi:MAG: DNA polymerase III subunit delta' [Thermodesulfovibrionales bacterium]
MSLREVIGQDKAVQLLLNTLKTGRVPSALLFAGEPGIGKRYTAFNFAKALNCPGQELDSCDNCTSCKKIDSGVHPDILFLRPERGEIRVDEIRSIEEALSFKPFEGKRKVVIIDEAEKMNQSASNAFLKTLEEPPSDSIIIMISSSPDSLPATIRSRCCRIDFLPIPERDVERIVKKICSDSDRDLRTLVRLSMGRPGLIASSDTFGDREKLPSTVKALLMGSGSPWKDREELEAFIENLMLLVRDMAFYKLNYETGILNMDIKDLVKELTTKCSLGDIINTYERLLLLRRQLDFNLNINITWNYLSYMFKNLAKGGS